MGSVKADGTESPIKIYTVGYGNRAWEDFSRILVGNEIGVVIDVRREGSRAWSHVYTQGYRHFANRLLQIRPHDKAIWYVAAPELSNIPAPLKDYDAWLHRSEGAGVIKSWMHIFDSYMHLGINPCLMCAELLPYKNDEVNCHRVLIADCLRERLLYWTGYDYSIVHL